MSWWLLVPVAAVVLFALAWWTSGRSTEPLPRDGPGSDGVRDHHAAWSGAETPPAPAPAAAAAESAASIRCFVRRLG